MSCASSASLLGKRFAESIPSGSLPATERKTDFPDGDKYREKATSLARGLISLCDNPDHSNTRNAICLCGSWGSGKTTFLSQVVYELEELGFGAPERGWGNKRFTGSLESEPCTNRRIMYFNPWFFPTQESLALQFLNEIEDKFSRSAPVKKSFSRLKQHATPILGGATKAVLSYGVNRALQHISDENVRRDVEDTLGELTGISLTESGKGNDASLLKCKQDLRAKLLASRVETRIVIIDNLDRLQEKEICRLFWLIGAVLDLPKLVFLVACDRKIVARALNGKKRSLEGYEDKVIGAYIDLPRVNLSSIIKHDLDQLTQNDSRLESFNYADCFAVLLETYRQYGKAKAECASNQLMTPFDDKSGYLDRFIDTLIHSQFPELEEKLNGLTSKELAAVMRAVRVIPDSLAKEQAEKRREQSNGTESTGAYKNSSANITQATQGYETVDVNLSLDSSQADKIPAPVTSLLDMYKEYSKLIVNSSHEIDAYHYKAEFDELVRCENARVENHVHNKLKETNGGRINLSANLKTWLIIRMIATAKCDLERHAAKPDTADPDSSISNLVPSSGSCRELKPPGRTQEPCLVPLQPNGKI